MYLVNDNLQKIKPDKNSGKNSLKILMKVCHKKKNNSDLTKFRNIYLMIRIGIKSYSVTEKVT